MPPKPVAPAPSKLVAAVKKSSITKNREPLWKGPEDSSDQGGITQSLLSKFLVCRERFRVRVIEGLAPNDQFNKNMEYGNMWHVCEESFAANPKGGYHSGSPFNSALDAYVRKLHDRYRFAGEEIMKWSTICRMQFPIYCKYWSQHPDVLNRTPVLQEYAFKVPYKLPSGRTVYLRGKFDSVDIIGKGRSAALYLQENKTKSEIDVEMLKRQLSFDLQTMMYLIALKSYQEQQGNHLKDLPLMGVRYNVIRRPLGGGRGSIKRHEARGSKPEETWEHFFDRLRTEYLEKEPEAYFERFKSEILPEHYDSFKATFFNPCLEQLCDWYTDVVHKFAGNSGYSAQSPRWDYCNYRTPFGIYNPLLEQGFTDVDEYLATGNTVGLTRTPLFQEL